MPKAHADGTPIQPSELPGGLPASINLKPELRVEGQTQATGSSLRTGSEPIGAGAFTRYNDMSWDETTDQLIAGQQSALGVSIQGISAQQMQTLKTRMEATKTKLEQAQAAPQNQQATILNGMTGENLSGDMLTATIWGYFANLQNYGVISQSQTSIYDRQALTYGLFHAEAQPKVLFGVVTTGVSFKGLNMDVGHLRHIRWDKANNRDNWIAYNHQRGQHASAMEHATPEQFWVDKTKCRYTDENNIIQNPTLADCAQAVSAVKALAIAQSQGQKVYTITVQNAATALPKLALGGSSGKEIRNAIQAGMEVTFHEIGINAFGWSGMGYSIIDPDTGSGGYLIEGKVNGGGIK